MLFLSGKMNREKRDIADDEETKYTVRYTDGVDEEVIFADQVYGNLLSGVDTPAFKGTPTREGYVFKGWKPAVAEKVTGDVTYVAVWEKAKDNNGDTKPGDTKPGDTKPGWNVCQESEDQRYSKSCFVDGSAGCQWRLNGYK